MLDNGYVYLATTRLSLYRSASDWAMVFEVFGFSPRTGLPDTSIQTFASILHDRDPPESYVNQKAYEMYLASNPNDEFRSIFPVDEGPWQDTDDGELVAEDASELLVRGQAVPLPNADEYARYDIALEEAPRVRVYELCRYLAEIAREQVLATPAERRVSVLPEMEQILQLEEWHHPNVVDEKQRPSGSETFRQLAQVLATGDVRLYQPPQAPNTHWKNWPDGGSL
jgi:hypothetical protein